MKMPKKPLVVAIMALLALLPALGTIPAHAGGTEAADFSESSLQWHSDSRVGSEAAAVPDSTYRYRIDPNAVKNEFSDNGIVTIHLDEEARLVVRAEESDIFASRNVYEFSIAGGAVKVGEITSIPLHGVVEGVPDSTASLTLGEWGIYGLVTWPGVSLNLIPDMDGSHHAQNVETYVTSVDAFVPAPIHHLADQLGDDISVPMHSLSGSTTSRIWVQTDNVLANAKPNWEDLATSAFNQHVTIWLTKTNIKINLQIVGIGVITDATISTSGACGNTGTNYVNYLTNYFNTVYGPWWHQAHQFWGGTAFSDARGCALEDTVGYANPQAVAIVSGVDISGQSYDVDSLHHRGIVSGHELGHVYGSGHYYATSLGKYEMMASGVSLNSQSFFFGTSSSNHIHCRFYHNTEPACS